MDGLVAPYGYTCSTGDVCRWICHTLKRCMHASMDAEREGKTVWRWWWGVEWGCSVCLDICACGWRGMWSKARIEKEMLREANSFNAFTEKTGTPFILDLFSSYLAAKGKENLSPSLMWPGWPLCVSFFFLQPLALACGWLFFPSPSFSFFSFFLSFSLPLYKLTCGTGNI